MDPPKEPVTPTPKPVMDIQPPQPENPVVSDAPAQTTEAPTPAQETKEAATPLVAQVTAATAKRKAPVGAIVSAVVIAVGLAVVSVVAYTKTDDKPATVKTTTQTSTEAAKPAAVTGADVDAAIKGIDDSMSTANDATEFDTNSLSDTALSL